MFIPYLLKNTYTFYYKFQVVITP